VETPGKGGRRHEYMTLEEERELLTPFFELAKKGEITTIAHIKQVFEKRVGHEVDETLWDPRISVVSAIISVAG
jgi:hypothetical protein